MKYFYPKYHALHHPSIDLSDGLPGFTHLEVPQRVDEILQGLLEAKECEVVEVSRYCQELVRRIHESDYVDFLLAISKEIDKKTEYIPPVFRSNLKASPVFFQGGMYTQEIGTPIGADTIKTALNSAYAAKEATEYFLQNQSSCFVLTRPPGHHAGRRRYGGYCFFNNAYICADILNKANHKVVVVDIDYHIGDGSLEFATKEAAYFSIHADVHRNYPYLQSDFVVENPHVTLQSFQTGIDGQEYIQNVKNLLEKAKENYFDSLILSLGFDTLESDYCQDEYIHVQKEDYYAIGKLFGALEQNVLILLEGGYDTPNLRECAKNFMSGFMAGKNL